MFGNLPTDQVNKLRTRGFPDDLISSFATSNGKPATVDYLTAEQIQSDWLDRFPRMKGNDGGALVLRFNETTYSLRPDKPAWDADQHRFTKYLYQVNNPDHPPHANIQPWIPPAELGAPKVATEGLFDALVCTYLIGIPCAAATAPTHLRTSNLPSSVEVYLSDSDVPFHHAPGLLPSVISQARERNLKLAHLPRNPRADYRVTERIHEDCKWGCEEWFRHWTEEGKNPKAEMQAVLRSALKASQYLRSIILEYERAGIAYPKHSPTLTNAAKAIADAAATGPEVQELTELLYASTKAAKRWVNGLVKERMAKRIEKGLPVATEQIDAKAKELALQVTATAIYDDPDIPAHKQVFHLRQRAAELELRGLSSNDLQRYFHDIRRKREGSTEPLSTGDKLDRTPVMWAWDGVIRAQTSNLVTAMPKVGKTNLFTAMLAAWAAGAGRFLDRQLVGPCPPIVIAGPDMNDGDWYLPLQRVGLVEEDGTIRDPIKKMFTAKHRFTLSPEGIDKLVEIAIEHPGFVLLLDSYHAAIHGMGICEKDEALADPLLDLVQALAPYNCTTIVVHHSGKGDGDGDPIKSSRGSTALTGVPSMVVGLSRKGGDNPLQPADSKITLKARGRCPEPANLVIEQTESGWVSHGHADGLEVVQYIEAQIAEITDTQEDILKGVTQQWQKFGIGIGNHWVATTFGKDTKAAGKVLRALEKRGLLVPAGNAPAEGKGGRERVLFKPHDAVIPFYPCHREIGLNGGNGGNATSGEQPLENGKFAHSVITADLGGIGPIGGNGSKEKEQSPQCPQRTQLSRNGGASNIPPDSYIDANGNVIAIDPDDEIL